METATVANGCFWCTEAIFKRLKGVHSVMPGYSGGTVDNPTYDAVSTGKTGHAEAIQIEFDPSIIDYKTLLEVFWKTHDPTTLNQQGNDIGSQYRSAIFYHSPEQQKIAEQSKEELDHSDTYPDPIVTEIVQFKKFWPAEDYHQNFYENNREYGYCKLVIDPKIEKLSQDFPEELKTDLAG